MLINKKLINHYKSSRIHQRGQNPSSVAETLCPVRRTSANVGFAFQGQLDCAYGSARGYGGNPAVPILAYSRSSVNPAFAFFLHAARENIRDGFSFP